MPGQVTGVDPAAPSLPDQSAAGFSTGSAGAGIGLDSALSISSIVRPRVSIAISQKAKAPRTYQEAK